jgi:cytochrome c peroxidase
MLAAVLTALLVGGFSFINFSNLTTKESTALAVTQDQSNLAEDLIAPLPFTHGLDVKKVELGKLLFNDPRLSGDGTISCAHCHNLATGGVDRLPHSLGLGGKEGGINTPSVFNSGFNFRQFWDGRALTLEDQIEGPLHNPAEMGGTWAQTIDALSKDTAFRNRFKAIYSDGLQPRNIKDAIATFERSLTTPNARFDQYLRGNQNALTAEELAGYRLFKQIGCTSCHQGLNIGGNMFQKLGIMEDYFVVRGHLTEADLGRFNLTHLEEDRHFFRVPSLRNIALTPPYLHDASAKTLEDAVAIMTRYQLGMELNPVEMTRIVAFLHTLTGEYEGRPLE